MKVIVAELPTSIPAIVNGVAPNSVSFSVPSTSSMVTPRSPPTSAVVSISTEIELVVSLPAGSVARTVMTWVPSAKAVVAVADCAAPVLVPTLTKPDPVPNSISTSAPVSAVNSKVGVSSLVKSSVDDVPESEAATKSTVPSVGAVVSSKAITLNSPRPSLLSTAV